MRVTSEWTQVWYEGDMGVDADWRSPGTNAPVMTEMS